MQPDAPFRIGAPHDAAHASNRRCANWPLRGENHFNPRGKERQAPGPRRYKCCARLATHFSGGDKFIGNGGKFGRKTKCCTRKREGAPIIWVSKRFLAWIKYINQIQNVLAVQLSVHHPVVKFTLRPCGQLSTWQQARQLHKHCVWDKSNPRSIEYFQTRPTGDHQNSHQRHDGNAPAPARL